MKRESVMVYFKTPYQKRLLRDVERYCRGLEMTKTQFMRKVIAEFMNDNDIGTYTPNKVNPPRVAPRKPYEVTEKKKPVARVGNKKVTINEYTKDVLECLGNGGYNVKIK